MTSKIIPDIIPFNVGDIVTCRTGSIYKVVYTFKKKIGGYYLIASDTKGEQFVVHRKEILNSKWVKL